VAFGDLPAQNETDAGTALLGREERHEQVRSVRQAGAFILDGDLEPPLLRRQPTVTVPPPTSRQASAALRIKLISNCSS
jgi:hypothetical protein